MVCGFGGAGARESRHETSNVAPMNASQWRRVLRMPRDYGPVEPAVQVSYATN